MTTNQRILYFEPGSGGHHLDYMTAVLNNLHETYWTVACPKELWEQLNTKTNASMTGGVTTKTNLYFDYCDFQPIALTHPSNPIKYLIAAISAAKKANCNIIFHPGIDALMYAPAALLMLSQRMHVGIYFRPPTRPSSSNMLNIRNTIKYFLATRSVRTKRIATVFTLDPNISTGSSLTEQGIMNLRYLPELSPVSRSEFQHSADTGLSPRISKKRPMRFIIFGALQRRKGIHETLAALSKLTPDEAQKVRLVICGALNDDMRGLPQLIQDHRYSSRVSLKTGFLEKSQLITEVASSDFILCPYINFHGSSGVLKWAAASNTPVICHNLGKMASDVKQYSLGRIVDPNDTEAYANTIRSVLASGFPLNMQSCEDYLTGHEPHHFAARIGSALQAAAKEIQV